MALASSRGGRVRVYFDADTSALERGTRAATGQLGRFDSAVSRSGQTTRRAGTYSDRFHRSTSRVGSALKGAAISAASAAAAYLSISQAVSAVRTTQDLAKTTAGLHRNLGLTVKTASEWGAVAQSREIDTRSLNMAFKTLSQQMIAAKRGTETSVQAFQDVGITQKDLQRTGTDFNDLLLLMANRFGDAEGGAKRMQAAGRLLGRGYQTLIPLFADGAKGLKEQQKWADEYGATLNQKTLKAQFDLIMAQRESKIAWLGLQSVFAQAVTPMLETANRKFQRLARIMGDDRLTKAERFKKMAETIGRWGNKAFDAFVAVLPKIVEEAGERAPRVAGAFVKGFMRAPVWGQLLIGGWLISRLGGVGRFRKVGTRGGTAFGKGFGLGIMAGLVLMGPEIQRELDKALGVERDSGDNRIIPVDIPGLDFSGGGLPVPDFLGGADDDAKKRLRGVNKEFNRTETEIGATTGRGRKRARHNFEGIARDGKRHSTELRRDVVRNVGGMANQASEGIGTLGENANRALKAFGVKTLKFGLKKVQGGGGGSGGWTDTGFGGHFAGGGRMRVPGTGTGDSVLMQAAVEPGEDVFVMNRNATAALEMWNDLFPRFQLGGRVPGLRQGGMAAGVAAANQLDRRQFPYSWGGGHGGFGLEPMDCSGAVSYVLHAMGLLSSPMVSGSLAHWGSPGTGPLTVYANAGHTFMSMNGKYFGTSGANPGGGAGWFPAPDSGYLSGFARRTMGVSGAAATGDLARMVLTGPKGPLRSYGQAALDKVRAAGNRYLGRRTLGGGQPLADLRGPGKTVGASVYGFGEAGTGTVGASGQDLRGKLAFAELAMGHALGGLPMGKKLGIRVGGRSAVGEKLDVGAGGGSVQGRPRAIDFWRDLAQRLGLDGTFLGLAKVTGLRRGGRVRGSRLAGGGRPRKRGKPKPKPGKVRPGALRGTSIWPSWLLDAVEGVLGTRPVGLSFDQMIEVLDVAVAQAEATPGTDDELALLTGQRGATQSQLAREQERLRKMKRQFRKGGLSAKERERLGEQTSRVTDLQSSLSSLNSSIRDLGESSSEDTQSLVDALAELKASIDEQNALAQSELAVGLVEARAALASLISGELGGRITQQAYNAGAGSVVRS